MDVCDPKIAEVVDWRPFEYLGRISLSMYLWHFPLLMALGGSVALGEHLLRHPEQWQELVTNGLLGPAAGDPYTTTPRRARWLRPPAEAQTRPSRLRAVFAEALAAGKSRDEATDLYEQALEAAGL